MSRDFGVQLEIPEDRLCPPVPNRINYLLWIQDIMKASLSLRTETTKAIHGIDMLVTIRPCQTICLMQYIISGTGATAIYPLLACKLEPDWKMTATGNQVFAVAFVKLFFWYFTELDNRNYECALRNVETNDLSGQITIKRAQTTGAILFPLEEETARCLNG